MKMILKIVINKVDRESGLLVERFFASRAFAIAGLKIFLNTKSAKNVTTWNDGFVAGSIVTNVTGAFLAKSSKLKVGGFQSIFGLRGCKTLNFSAEFVVVTLEIIVFDFEGFQLGGIGEYALFVGRNGILAEFELSAKSSEFFFELSDDAGFFSLVESEGFDLFFGEFEFFGDEMNGSLRVLNESLLCSAFLSRLFVTAVKKSTLLCHVILEARNFKLESHLVGVGVLGGSNGFEEADVLGLKVLKVLNRLFQFFEENIFG